MLWSKNKPGAMLHDLFNQSFAILFTKLNHCEEIRMQAQVIRPLVTLQKMSLSVPFTLCYLLIRMNHSLLKKRSQSHVPFVNLAAVIWSCIPVQTPIKIPPTSFLSWESSLLGHEPGNHCSLISLSSLSATYSCLWQAFILRCIL